MSKQSTPQKTIMFAIYQDFLDITYYHEEMVESDHFWAAYEDVLSFVETRIKHRDGTHTDHLDIRVTPEQLSCELNHRIQRYEKLIRFPHNSRFHYRDYLKACKHALAIVEKHIA